MNATTQCCKCNISGESGGSYLQKRSTLTFERPSELFLLLIVLDVSPVIPWASSKPAVEWQVPFHQDHVSQICGEKEKQNKTKHHDFAKAARFSNAGETIVKHSVQPSQSKGEWSVMLGDSLFIPLCFRTDFILLPPNSTTILKSQLPQGAKLVSRSSCLFLTDYFFNRQLKIVW